MANIYPSYLFSIKNQYCALKSNVISDKRIFMNLHKIWNIQIILILVIKIENTYEVDFITQ
jgi:hypothetical protein